MHLFVVVTKQPAHTPYSNNITSLLGIFTSISNAVAFADRKFAAIPPQYRIADVVVYRVTADDPRWEGLVNEWLAYSARLKLPIRTELNKVPLDGRNLPWFKF